MNKANRWTVNESVKSESGIDSGVRDVDALRKIWGRPESMGVDKKISGRLSKGVEGEGEIEGNLDEEIIEIARKKRKENLMKLRVVRTPCTIPCPNCGKINGITKQIVAQDKIVLEYNVCAKCGMFWMARYQVYKNLVALLLYVTNLAGGSRGAEEVVGEFIRDLEASLRFKKP